MIIMKDDINEAVGYEEFSVEIKDGFTDFNIKYRLKIEDSEPCKKIDGTIGLRGSATHGIIDDIDFDDDYMEVEYKAIEHIIDDLKKRFPGKKFEGTIESEFVSVHHGPHEYKIASEDSYGRFMESKGKLNFKQRLEACMK